MVDCSRTSTVVGATEGLSSGTEFGKLVLYKDVESGVSEKFVTGVL